MSTTSKLLALALTATLQSAMAAPVVLTFEDVTSTAWFAGKYNGVDISGSAWLATSEACGDDLGVSFDRDGSCGALYLAAKDTDTAKPRESLTLGFTGGFDTLSFLYSYGSSTANLDVQVYDAKGEKINSRLSSTLSGAGCASGFLFCNWSTTPISVIFEGVASSVTFTAGNQLVVLDDISFTPVAATNPLPEPASMALALGALGAAGWTRRRTAR